MKTVYHVTLHYVGGTESLGIYEDEVCAIGKAKAFVECADVVVSEQFSHITIEKQYVTDSFNGYGRRW